jgi:deazaflavin-dependent oxidoreductase (nitroreductase family)
LTTCTATPTSSANSTQILILFTTGRKSQTQRRHALIFREWNGSYLVVASKGGAEAPPEWFLNLAADPHAEVQIQAQTTTTRPSLRAPSRLWSSNPRRDFRSGSIEAGRPLRLP